MRKKTNIRKKIRDLERLGILQKPEKTMELKRRLDNVINNLKTSMVWSQSVSNNIKARLIRLEKRRKSSSKNQDLSQAIVRDRFIRIFQDNPAKLERWKAFWAKYDSEQFKLIDLSPEARGELRRVFVDRESDRRYA